MKIFLVNNDTTGHINKYSMFAKLVNYFLFPSGVNISMVQLNLNLITRTHYLASNTTFLLSVWSETRILD